MSRDGIMTALLGFTLAYSVTASGQVGQSKYLYTKPDASAGGGIKGTITRPQIPLSAVFALPPDEPRFVYKGTVTRGAAGSGFVFTGLQTARYDLLLVFDNAFYEGLTLNRGDDTLTPEDQRLIRKIIMKSEPFSNRKEIHRMLGKTGKMTGKARCMCTFVRTDRAMGFIDGKWYRDHRRSFKLVLVEDVGPAWQVVKTREIYVTQIKPASGKDVIRHVYRPYLGRIRVTDKMKDLGKINLSKTDR